MNIQNTDACAKKNVSIQKENLPLCCPQINNKVWNMHPRVYLTFDSNGNSTCPYCGTNYHLASQ